jgi:NADP-dependent 3-hydroxy acid dehydrogenase YdfG
MNPNGTGAQALKKMRIQILEMDVTNEDDVKRARITVENYLNDNNEQLWAIVNNAGLFTVGETEWGNFHILQKVFDVNVFGLTRVTRHFLPLIRNSRGRVVNIASVAGRWTTSGLAFYSMTKHAVIALSDALRREMSKWDVKVITIEPEAYRYSNSYFRLVLISKLIFVT